MQVTFLVGNGFDISCGIDTSYRSFYNWYLKQDSASEAIKVFKTSIEDDLFEGGNNWADFEAGLGKYTQNFTKETVDDFIQIYEDAREHIITYIESERNKFTDCLSIPEMLSSLKNGILHFDQELTPDGKDILTSIKTNDQQNETIIKFISFNYTNTLDICVKELSKNPLSTWRYGSSERKFYVHPSVLHIHGTLDHYPILGVGEDYQFTNKELLTCPGIAEIMLKSKSVKVMGEHWYKDAKAEINRSLIICIWGMSLGDTDSLWWNTIAEWLSADKSRQLIIFWWTETPPKGRSIFRYINEKAHVVERLMQHTSYSREKIQQLSERIHIVYNTETVLRVPFKEKESNLKNYF